MSNNSPAASYLYGNFTALQNYIMGLLGGNLVDIELTQDDYTNAYQKAKATWFQKGNMNLNEQFIPFNAIQGQASYNLSVLTTPAIDTIIKFNIPTSTFYTQNPFSIALFTDLMLGFINQQGMDIYTYEGTLEFLDLINLYTVAYSQYTFNRRTQTLTLMKPPSATDIWFIHAFTFPADVDLYNLLWVQEWMLAECKDTLGHAYQKYSTIQGPAGDISLPGAALIQEAKDMKTELLQNIADYTDGDESGGYVLMG